MIVLLRFFFRGFLFFSCLPLLFRSAAQVLYFSCFWISFPEFSCPIFILFRRCIFQQRCDLIHIPTHTFTPHDPDVCSGFVVCRSSASRSLRPWASAATSSRPQRKPPARPGWTSCSRSSTSSKLPSISHHSSAPHPFAHSMYFPTSAAFETTVDPDSFPWSLMSSPADSQRSAFDGSLLVWDRPGGSVALRVGPEVVSSPAVVCGRMSTTRLSISPWHRQVVLFSLSRWPTAHYLPPPPPLSLTHTRQTLPHTRQTLPHPPFTAVLSVHTTVRMQFTPERGSFPASAVGRPQWTEPRRWTKSMKKEQS